MILLMKVPLLLADFLPKYIWIYHFFHFFFWLLLLTRGLNQPIVGQPLDVYRSLLSNLAGHCGFARKWRLIAHSNAELYQMFGQGEEGMKLWQKIGLDQQEDQPFSLQRDCPSLRRVDSNGWPSGDQRASPVVSVKAAQVRQVSMREGSEGRGSQGHRAEHFQRMIQTMQLQVRQVQQSEQVMIAQESQVLETMGVGAEAGSSERGEELDSFYNYDLSHPPQSVTPLVYSKNSRRAEQVHFRKGFARFGVLKLNISQTRQYLHSIKVSILQLLEQVRRSHDSLREQLCMKYYQFERQYSIKMQESMFTHRQELEQLRYQYDSKQGREEVAREVVASELMIPEMEASAIQPKDGTGLLEELMRQNGRLKERVEVLEGEKGKLVKEATQFKSKIADVEATTVEVRQSNDKLYEYIFDLEQKLAFHKEELPKMAANLRAELEEYYGKQLGQTDEQRQRLGQRCLQLQAKLKDKSLQLQQVTDKLQSYKGEITELKSAVQKRNNGQSQITKLQESKSQEIQHLTQRNEQQIAYFQRLLEEKENMLTECTQALARYRGQAAHFSRESEFQNVSRTREGIEGRQREGRPTEAFDAEKLGLQKENAQLKATVDFISKTQASQSYETIIPSRNYMPFPGHYPSGPQFHTEKTIPQSNLYMKERELMKYQGYLQSEAHKLEAKQRQMEMDYAVRRNIQLKYKQNINLPQRVYETTANQDDYGMKTVAPHGIRTYNAYPTNQRKNNFCSSEAQAIIQKVKLRQRRNQFSSNCHCQDARNCRCQVVSRGSRTSQDSNNKQYRKIQHYRPNNYSPSNKIGDYLGYDDKNSKMKLIQDKVRRLKTQLKNSLSAIKD